MRYILCTMVSLKFIADENVGKLGRYLRRLGFDTLLFDGGEDREMLKQALAEGRVVLTRDTHIEKYGVAVSGRVRVVTFHTDNPGEQLKQVIETLDLDKEAAPLTRCLECNIPLEERSKDEIAERVPPFVLKTQKHYVECPGCKRVYWRGTHWRAMQDQFEGLKD
jgi:uncharacterized protein with PIN domain